MFVKVAQWLTAWCLVGLAASAAAQEPQLKAYVNGLPSSRGVVRCALFASAKGFPDEPKQAIRGVAVRVVQNRAVCAFDGLKPGVYALSFFHDENRNGKLDTNWLGMPEEPYGTSNNPEPRLGPPEFAPARFVYRGKPAHLKVRPID
jgi:uncharacterized protein (DUF2141 family)